MGCAERAAICGWVVSSWVSSLGSAKFSLGFAKLADGAVAAIAIGISTDAVNVAIRPNVPPRTRPQKLFIIFEC